jgi:hypothetical protein
LESGFTRKVLKLQQNPCLQYFGLGGVRVWGKYSQGVCNKMLYLILKFWGNLGSQKQMKEKDMRTDPASWVENAS